MADVAPAALLISGTVGSGKTSAAEALGERLRAGARRLVLAGVLEDAAARSRYAEAVGVPLRVARLRVDLPLVRERLAARHAGRPAELAWHLQRCGELDAILATAGAEDVTVDVGHLDVDAVAAALAAAAGWDDRPA